MAVNARQKMEFLLGDVTEPDEEESKGTQKMEGLHKHGPLMAAQLSSLTTGISTSFFRSEDPGSLWAKLSIRYNQANGSILYDVLVQSFTLKQGQNFVCNYYTKLTRLWIIYDKRKRWQKRKGKEKMMTPPISF